MFSSTPRYTGPGFTMRRVRELTDLIAEAQIELLTTCSHTTALKLQRLQQQRAKLQAEIKPKLVTGIPNEPHDDR